MDKTFDSAGLPSEITARFNVTELLSKNDMGETFLLSEKDGGKWYVLKSFAHGKITYSEAEILGKLEHKGLPKYEPEITDGETVFTLREYIEGVPLDEYVVDSQTLDDAEAVKILCGLCDIVSLLHSQPTPIIHRDIKPSNIIFNPIDDSVAIIDFGISRIYKEDSVKDTSVYATREFASPEQFGFAQTDARSDIFSLGVLLIYMLTGKTERDTPIDNKALANIARKCTEFAPKERYQNADALKKALENLPRPVNKTFIGMAAAFFLGAAAMLVAVLLFAGVDIFTRGGTPYAENAYNRSLPPFDVALAPIGEREEIYNFREPLVERAVRYALGIDAYTPITYGDLEAIEEILIFGMNPFICYYDLPDGEGIRGRGDIRVAEDFARMPNLQRLYLRDQSLDDISPLANNTNLYYLRLERVNVSDITPLMGHPSLSLLALHDHLINEWHVIETIPNLSHLHISGENINIRSVSDLGDISNLNFFGIRLYPGFECLEGIQNLLWLRHLDLYQTGVRDFSLINDRNATPRLYHVYLSDDKLPYLHTITRADIDLAVYENGALRAIAPAQP